MTESAGVIRAVAEIDDNKIYLGIIVESLDDTLDALSQIYEWRVGERVRVIGNEI